MSRRVWAVILAAAMIFLLAACFDGSKADGKYYSGRLKIVATIFPEYDWVREILGERAEEADLIWLSDNGVDMHSYQPGVDDIIDISTCDLFIYVGGESDSWVESSLEEAENDNMKVIRLLDVLGDRARQEETPEGAQGEDEADDYGYDEHVWLSLKNAEIFVYEITEALAELDEDNAEYYRDNAASYIDRLSELDESYKTVVDDAKTKTLLFGDRFPFRYMVEDYGLEYYAAFEGCSSEVEASFETIAFLAGKLDEESLSAVFVTENSDKSVADAIIESSASADGDILVLDSLQSVTGSDADKGTTYISLMEENLEVLEGYLLK